MFNRELSKKIYAAAAAVNRLPRVVSVLLIYRLCARASLLLQLIG
jgi:hypothetical protein